MRRLIVVIVLATICPQVSAASNLPVPVSLTDSSTVDGTITVETDEWKLVFSERFNWGPHQWFDLASDPGETDNLATASFGGTYSQGALFDYNVYLGTTALLDAFEFMTTLGENASPGAAEVEILENTSVRVRIEQRGHPRLNNAQGPPADPFIELELVDFTTIWTLYPTGKVHIDFRADLNPAGSVVDSGPGGAGKGIDAPGGVLVDASGGANFLTDSG